jgi:hypothetical protein
MSEPLYPTALQDFLTACINMGSGTDAFETPYTTMRLGCVGAAGSSKSHAIRSPIQISS